MELECEICYCPFDEEETRPRVLPCAHSYCESCIDNNIKKDRKTCPACREPFSIETAKDLPANFALEKLLQKVSLIDDRPEEESIDDFNLGICPKHKHNRLYFVCKGYHLSNHVSGPICRDCKVLDHSCCNVISVEDDIKELKKSRTEDANELIETSEVRIHGLKLFNERISGDIKMKEQMVQNLLEEIEELNEIKSRAEQAESLISENMNAVKDSQSRLEMSSTKKEITEACQDVLNKIHDGEEYLDDIDVNYDLDIEFGEEYLLLKPTNFIQKMKEFEYPRVWAVAEIEEAIFGAHIFIKNDEVHMEALIENNVPPEDYEPVSAFGLHSLLPETNPKVYLTLSLNENILGTVYIKIYPSIKNNYGRQFLALFTGSLGPSYKGTSIFNKDDCTLNIYYYMKPDGTADSVPIVPDYNFGRDTFWKERGTVFNCMKGGFKIFHKADVGSYNTLYGNVTGGMEVIDSIVADNENWRDVKISDVGVVLG